MGTWSKTRRWINRNDGRLFRVQNESLSWYQVVGCLGLIGGMSYLHIRSRGSFAWPRWGGWLAILGGTLLLSAPWKVHDRVPDVPGDGSDSEPSAAV